MTDFLYLARVILGIAIFVICAIAFAMFWPPIMIFYGFGVAGWLLGLIE